MTAHIVVCGVAGSGKSSLGRALAARLERPFIEGDDYHTTASRAKMAAGVPLNDEDRAPWLDALAALLRDSPVPTVLACSALRYSYRARLRTAGSIWFVQLLLDPADAEQRIAARGRADFPASLAQSQFDAFEPLRDDEPGVTLDATSPIDVLVTDAIARLHLI